MQSDYLKSFVEVVRTGSFTKAADNLCITQSAVTQRIQTMEKLYECLLLDRNGTQFSVTEKGKHLFDKAVELLEMEKKLTSEMTKKNNCKNFNFKGYLE